MTKCDVAAFADNPKIYWSYCPSEAAAILFVVLYGLTTLVHLAQAIIYRQKNAYIITFGGLLETTAFILRLIVIKTLDLSEVYEAQFILILIAPLWINAFDFVLLGRLVDHCLPDRKLMRIPAKRIAILFICGDIGAFLLQLGGAAITTSTDNKTVNIGLHVYTAGVALQQCFIFCFLALSIAFRRRLKKECDPEKANGSELVLNTIWVSLALISLRIIFRIVEFAGDNNSKLSREIGNHEIYLYLFDCLPMICALFIFNVVHPARVLRNAE
ncbi:putative lipid transporter atnI [Exophiala dermatitidis]